MTVFAYLRWSTLEQGNSDRSSADRQRINIDSYAARVGLTIDQTLIDSGKSAYTGANLKNGELGTLATKLRNGIIDPATTILIVEELDRLSRRPPAEMISWMMPLLMSGVTIHVANINQVITVESVNRDFGSFLSLMSHSFSAFEFSRKQQDRGNASWTKRRKAAVEGQNLSRHRARKWLEWNPATKSYDPIPDRVLIVREMFKLRLKGWGKAGIAKLFNERAASGDDRYRVWASTKRAPEQWTASAIARVVQDPAVIGLVQYSRFPRGADKRVPIGDPVKVYPVVVDEETFARANERRLGEQLKYQGRGRSVSNLLGRISKCAECGGSVGALGSSRWRTNKDGSKSQHYFLYCLTAKMSRGKDCFNQAGWAYYPIEQAIIDRLLTLAIDDAHFRNDDETGARLEGEVIRLQRKLTDQTNSAKRVLAIITEDADDELAADQYTNIKLAMNDTKKALTEAQEAFSKAQGKVSPAEHVVRVGEVRARMESDDEQERYEARSLVKRAFADLIERITFHPATRNVSVMLVDRMRLFSISRTGELINDLDLTKMGGGPGYGKATTYENATVAVDEDGNHAILSGDATAIANDLNGDQHMASAAYVRRKEAAD